MGYYRSEGEKEGRYTFSAISEDHNRTNHLEENSLVKNKSIQQEQDKNQKELKTKTDTISQLERDLDKTKQEVKKKDDIIAQKIRENNDQAKKHQEEMKNLVERKNNFSDMLTQAQNQSMGSIVPKGIKPEDIKQQQSNNQGKTF